MNSDLQEIRAGLQDRVGDLCRQLLPRGRMEGGLWVSVNPTVAGDERKVPALKVRVSGGDLGAWTDHRNGRDGHKGDVIGLVAYLNGTDTKGALKWARDFLGLQRMTRQERDAMRFAGAARAAKAEKDAEARRLSRLTEADRLFATPDGAGLYGPARCEGTSAYGQGTPAELHARAYLESRRAALEAVPTLNAKNFRFSAGTEWWKGAQRGEFGRKLQAGPLLPAIHSAMRSPIGIVTCCHVTFLDPVRPAKAAVENAKLMWGEKKGAVIELAMGPERKWFWTAERAAPLVICEGIETAGPLAAELGAEARVWAAGDLGNIGQAPVWLPCVGEIYVARDNNHGNEQAQRQLDAALESLERHGKPMAVMNSHVGDDFNDLANGKE